MITHLLYDGTFAGFLTAIFDCYDRKLSHYKITRPDRFQAELGSSTLDVITDTTKSQRVWTGLQKRLTSKKRIELYKTFLSELPEMETVLSGFIAYVFSNNESIEDDFSDPFVMAINRIAKQVHREKHRMEAFIRFQRTKDDLYFSSIDPDFNVLPLIIPHFKDRYADQDWLIFDRRRKYGITYNSSTMSVTEVNINFEDGANGEFLPSSLCHEDENQYGMLWKEYFDSVNISARKNLKLHVRHVPTRYWRYLTEKRDFG